MSMEYLSLFIVAIFPNKYSNNLIRTASNCGMIINHLFGVIISWWMLKQLFKQHFSFKSSKLFDLYLFVMKTTK